MSWGMSPQSLYCPCCTNLRWGKLPQPVLPNFLLLMQHSIQEEKPRLSFRLHISVICIYQPEVGVLKQQLLLFAHDSVCQYFGLGCGEKFTAIAGAHSSGCSILMAFLGLDSLRMPHSHSGYGQCLNPGLVFSLFSLLSSRGIAWNYTHEGPRVPQ